MTKRKALSKKVRFEVFKRDVFTCQYCGATPPKVILEVDHIIPVASGGENDENNLVTSCFDCNRGKGARSLELSPKTLAKKIEIQNEARDQLASFEKSVKAKKSKVTRKINKLNKIFEEETNHTFTYSFKQSIKQFFELLPEHEVTDAMEIALAKFNGEPSLVTKYFCGICWNKIKGDK
tara:strand:+ start:80 stop:616 length:537 start_codon:yes stop_codon:yes gene_type:complete